MRLQQSHFGNGVADPATIAILVFPETTASVVFGIYDLLRSTVRDWSMVSSGIPGPEVLRPLLVSVHDGPVMITNHVPVMPHHRPHELGVPDLIIVPEINLPPTDPLDDRFSQEVDWLQRMYAKGSIIASACSGAVLLAEAGLLDGEEATSHWAYCDMIREHYPQVKVHSEKALVLAGEGQRLVMAGGGTSWLDLTLYLIARLTNVEIAMQVARLNLIDWHSSGQQPYARLSRTRQVDDAAVAEVQTWIADRFHEPLPVAGMIAKSGLPERTFSRRFKLATGHSPLEYVHMLRLEEAKRMLEVSEEPVEAIALEVGYEDPAFFTRLFRRKVQLSPAQYRKRFGAVRRAMITS